MCVLQVASQISAIRSMLQQIGNGQVADVVSFLRPMVEQMTSLEQRLTDWTVSVPKEWDVRIQNTPETLANDFTMLYIPIVYIYQDLWIVSCSKIITLTISSITSDTS